MNQMVTQNFGGLMTQAQGTNLMADGIAAQTKAMVESRYIMAMRNPRNWDDVRTKLIKECSRPTFANNKSALYHKPIGGGVEGLGIRFVEVALRCMTNVLIETNTIYDDEQKEVVRVSVTDLEANVSYPIDIKISKTVERSKPSDDGSFISVRKNSYGKDVFTILATDEDMTNKRMAAISKAMRNAGLRIIPGDLCDEAEEIIRKIRTQKITEDPDGERKKIIDAFSSIGVKPSSIVMFLGHDIDQCSPSELMTLRGLYGALSDGEITWNEVMSSKETEENESGTSKVADAIKRSAEKRMEKKISKTKKENVKEQENAGKKSDQKKDENIDNKPMFSFAEIADMIKKAENSDQIDEAISLSSDLPANHIEELISIANEKRSKVNSVK